MNSEGVIINDGLLPKITDEDLYKAYELMCFSRIQESLQLEMNLEKDESNQVKKVKKVINFLPSTGQEATEVGYAFHLRKGIDWFVPAYRNNAA
jgi:pyruvate dehydrogenase E1 component alpha subunit